MHIPHIDKEVIKTSKFSAEEWDTFMQAKETEPFRVLRSKHDLHMVEIMKKFADVDSGEAPLTMAHIEVLRDALLRLHQLVYVLEGTVRGLDGDLMRFANEILVKLYVQVSDAQNTFKRAFSWVEQVNGLTAKKDSSVDSHWRAERPVSGR